MTELFMGIDAGTTSIKGILVDREGKIQADASEGIALSTPQAGWAEQDPFDWWNATIEVINRLVKTGIGEIKAISISGQMHSLVTLDVSGNVIRPAILWCDQRTESECESLTEKYGGEKEIIGAFGNPILTGFTAPKLLWLKENEPENFAKINKILLPKDYLAYKLTGNFSIEQSDASGTSLYRVKEGDYDGKIVKLIGIKRGALPPVLPSGSKIGEIECPDIPVLRGVPVIAGGADNAAAAYGCGVEKNGDVMFSLGTSGTVVAVTGKPDEDRTGRIHLFSHVISDTYYHMAVILSATNSLNWWRKNFSKELELSEIETLVSKSKPGSNGLIFLPYLNGERTPHRDSNARGTLFGFSSFHTEADVLRAIHEGVVFALREGLDCIRELGTPIKSARIVGGGSRSRVWCQMLADNTGLTVSRLAVDEGAAYGSARLAADFFNIDTSSWVKFTENFVPVAGVKNVYSEYFVEYKKLYKSLKESFERISRLQTNKQQ